MVSVVKGLLLQQRIYDIAALLAEQAYTKSH